MARTKNNTPRNRTPTQLDIFSYIQEYANMSFIKKLIFDPSYLYVTCWGLIIFEVILNIFIIQRIKYTEIDWIAYMQEVEGFLNGTLDYSHLKGDTGPLVYPAGFVYIYSILYYITSYGQNIRLAQYIFMMIYLCQLYLTFEIFCKTKKIPPYAVVLSTLTSYRIHSIFVLRLFNDPIAVFLFYVSISLFLKNYWIWGSVFYSLAVSVKMNILLYSPCLLIAYLTNLTLSDTIRNLFVCGLIQLILGLPFLYGNYWAYIKGSFDLGRIFEYKWTVNYRFLDRASFENRYFHFALLAMQVALLLMFLPAIKRYLSGYATLNNVINQLKSDVKKKEAKKKKEEEPLTKSQQKFLDGFEKQLQMADAKQRNVKKDVATKSSPKSKETYEIDFAKVTQLFILPFFITNLIGVACARSLHYQFYCWYFHSLLYLVHCTPYRKPVNFLILGIIEFCWNTYPSTVFSSLALHLCHILVIGGVYLVMNRKA